MGSPRGEGARPNQGVHVKNNPSAKSLTTISLRTKLGLLIAALLALVTLFQVTYFPTRMEEQSRESLERRAMGLATLLSNAVRPGLEFDDATNVTDLLALLSKSPEVRYGVLRKMDGKVFAAYHPEAVPKDLGTPGNQTRSTFLTDELRVDVPVIGKTEELGLLSLGLSLQELEAEVNANREVAMKFSGLVFLVGLFLSFLVGTYLVRPIQRMTAVALRIAAGDMSQEELRINSRDESGQLAEAFNGMLRTLQELEKAAGRMAGGDLTVRLTMGGQVADSFNRMLAELRRVVQQISQTSVQLASAATEIFAAVQDQEGAAARQAAAVEEVSKTMQSLLDSASHIAESARGVLVNAERAKETTDDTSTRIGELSRHTNRIAELLDVIRDIADRSDLLALNASLEATRAGEAGHAFSLVAGEMRRLAERVTATVENVKSLVADIRASGTASVMATDEARKISDGTTESARQITLVTQQQRTGTEQVSQSMRDISALLTQSVSGAKQTRSLAEGLKNQADGLEEVVGRFVLTESRDRDHGKT